MNKIKKISVIFISVLLILALLVLLGFVGLYLYSETVIFDHRDSSETRSGIEPVEGFSVNYPFFANSATINSSTGRTYTLSVWGGGEKNIEVYESVNMPIYKWVDYLYQMYLGRVNLDYTLEQDSKTISVSMSGNVNDGEKDIPVEQKFVFNIENAAPDNLPEWINQDEISDGYREFWDYVNDPRNVSKPDWLSEQIASS